MGKLCERPGCSENASVAYGMRPEDLVFWLDVLRPSEEISGGVLCRRHADSMSVPRNWTLDDLRDPDLHLFRPPPIQRSTSPRSRRSGARDETSEQLQLGDMPVGAVEDVESNEAVVIAGEPSVADSISDEPPGSGSPTTPNPIVSAKVEPPATDAVEAVETTTAASESESPWIPSFDSGDDLDGLLAARSPLLARAFRGDDRPS